MKKTNDMRLNIKTIGATVYPVTRPFQFFKGRYFRANYYIKLVKNGCLITKNAGPYAPNYHFLPRFAATGTISFMKTFYLQQTISANLQRQ